MSAYIITEKNAAYLGALANQLAIESHGSSIHIYWKDSKGNKLEFELKAHDHKKCAEFATILWQENVKSVNFRYREATNVEDYKISVKLIDESVIKNFSTRSMTILERIQAQNAVHCFDYQACEHPEYEKSLANAFVLYVDSIIFSISPEAQEIKWGFPE